MTEKNKPQRNGKMHGTQSIVFSNPPIILGAACIAGKKEGEGPLGSYFDKVEEDSMFGGTTWEDAESRMMLQTAQLALKKAGLEQSEIRYLVGGDLLGQLIATSFGVESLQIPLIGVYGACSTMGESLAVASVLVEGGFADRAMAITSSHFAGAEKQFRFPLAYGNQRPLAATWTVTGSGAVILGTGDKKISEKEQKDTTVQTESTDSKENRTIQITAVTFGKIVDYGIKDSMNMGACMAPAASAVIAAHFKDLGCGPKDYDKVVTGDLGMVGKDILIDLLKQEGFDITANHMDCGIEIFDPEVQDTHSGGSGCGCSAVTLCGYLLRRLSEKKWKRILFVPTGALLSTVSFNEGQSVPGIAHAVVLEAK